jgi:predicted O-linked N-acetylglucosamine transferase (SPINDLY family)
VCVVTGAVKQIDVHSSEAFQKFSDFYEQCLMYDSLVNETSRLEQGEYQWKKSVMTISQTLLPSDGNKLSPHNTRVLLNVNMDFFQFVCMCGLQKCHQNILSLATVLWKITFVIQFKNVEVCNISLRLG